MEAKHKIITQQNLSTKIGWSMLDEKFQQRNSGNNSENHIGYDLWFSYMI